MSAVRELRHVLWSVVLSTGCGRLGFGEEARGAAVAELAAQLDLVSECGAPTLETATITIRNTGSSELVIDDGGVTGGFSVVTKLPLVIAPGDEAGISVAPPAAVIGTDRGGELKQGELTLVTNEADVSIRIVALSATIVGANIEFRASSTTSMPLDLTFSATGGQCPPFKGMWIANEGTTQVMVTASSGVGLVTSFSSGIVTAGGGSSGVVRATTNGACSGMGSLTYVITGPSCTTTPVVLSSTINITGSSSCVCS